MAQWRHAKSSIPHPSRAVSHFSWSFVEWRLFEGFNFFCEFWTFSKKKNLEYLISSEMDRYKKCRTRNSTHTLISLYLTNNNNNSCITANILGHQDLNLCETHCSMHQILHWPVNAAFTYIYICLLLRCHIYFHVIYRWAERACIHFS